MKSGGKAIVWLVTGFALTLGTVAQANSSGPSSEGPYRAIVDRNVFDLRPVPPQKGPDPVVTPPPNVKLIGLMIISGHPQGVFSVQDPTPGKQPVSYILSEEQRQGTLEVKSINMAGKTAHVQIGADFAELKLEDPKAPTGPGPAAAAGLAGPGQRGFGPGGRAAGRTGLPMPTPGGAPSASYSPGASPADAGNGGLPTRPVRTDANEQPLTGEQQQVAIEQNREAYRQSGSPLADLLPPTQVGALMQNAANQPTGDNTTPVTQPNPQRTPLGQRIHNYQMPPGP
jgi:hypothetical protein